MIIIANPIKVLVYGQMMVKDFRYVLEAVFDPLLIVHITTSATGVAKAVRF